ncbi:GNAT family N-acetyltransferase [Clostridium perfringens]|uniref:GNAT family N-acetyltransferase n=1 Tax=Clostridium perfringens TaxID=1502 RepID=UPI0028E0D281|nr:GNAT family N-acetyltransferase [Clostridium perfringens]EHK2441507.1 GNAT family N-acetyltransferase [Clostridium perfringens]MDT9335014.1 GNAT family N-acetyltransferase [Clostridium perfringens]MDT9342774.1 GNAT family N-acetyltransferase [Clostridium perfringens]MDT9345954.1 GNAT family N-acetyltransferase [Clostridium perfringens]MDT9351858.1 GNAT family N-acetyltransferase [Clostridium perfringens]
MKYKIRFADKEDYKVINEIIREVHDLHVKNRPDVHIETDKSLSKEEFKEILGDDRYKMFLVQERESKEVVAFSLIQIIGPRNITILTPVKTALIDIFCVKENYRKSGIGKFLFEYIVSFVKKEEVNTLQLVVWEFNKEAIKFYESLGMQKRNISMELAL